MDEERSGDEADPAEPNEFDWMVGDDEEIEYDHGQGVWHYPDTQACTCAAGHACIWYGSYYSDFSITIAW